MKMKDRKRVLYSALISEEHAEKFKAVASAKEKTRASILRDWIDQGYARIEKDAKSSATENH